MSAFPAIEISGLRNRHPNGFLLDVETAEFETGRIYALVGPNGSGKTSLLNVLAGLTDPDAGYIAFKGDRINGGTSPEARRKIVLLGQTPYLFHTSVLDNVKYGLALRTRNRREVERRARLALNTVGLERLAGRDANRLSGGEAQLVALARAIAVDPELLLLDEPTASLDRDNATALEELVLRINRERKSTVIFTTHDLGQAYRLTTDVILMIGGQIVEEKPDNMFAGRVVEVSGSPRVKIGNSVSFAAVTDTRGDARIIIEPDDIFVSLVPLDSSARNSLKGTVVRATRQGHSVRVAINVGGHISPRGDIQGGVEFVALMSRRSHSDMNLNPGKKAWLTFKSTSVKVY